MWLNESNRPKHLVGGIITATLFSILFTAGCAFGMEYKDRAYGSTFDWLDITATLIGGLIGQAIQIGIACLIYYL